MNRKRDAIVAGLAISDDGYGSSSGLSARGRSMRNLQHTSEAPSMIDSDLLSGDDKSSSHLTSGVDSVYSFYNQNKEGSVSANGEKGCSQVSSIATGDEATPHEGKRKRGMDIQAIMNEMNAGLHERQKPSPMKQKEIMIDDGDRRGPELLTFRTTVGGKVKCRLSKRSAVLQDPLAKKYNLNEETHNPNSEISMLSAHSVVQTNKNGFASPPSKNVFTMGADPEKLKNFSGIYISPDANHKKPEPKKKSNGVDLRYKIRDLEAASKINSDDFFMTESPALKQSQNSKRAQEEQVEDNVNQQEIDSMVPLQAQGEAILKRQRLSQAQAAKQFIMKQRVERKSFKRPIVYLDDMQYPIISQAQILQNVPKVSPQKSVSKTNYLGLLKNYMVSSIKTEVDETEKTQEPIKLNVLALEKRCGLTSLICTDNNEDDQNTVRVLLCPLFSRRVKFYPGSQLTLKQYQSFDLTEVWTPSYQSLVDEFSIYRVTKAMIAQDFSTPTCQELKKLDEITMKTTSFKKSDSKTNSKQNSQRSLQKVAQGNQNHDTAEEEENTPDEGGNQVAQKQPDQSDEDQPMEDEEQCEIEKDIAEDEEMVEQEDE